MAEARSRGGLMRVGRGSALEAMIGVRESSGDVVPYIERMMAEHPWSRSYEVDDSRRPPRPPSKREHFHPSKDCTECARLLYFERMPDIAPMLDDGVTPRLQLIFKTGTALHCMLQALFEEMGRLPGYPGFVGNEVRLVDEGMNMGGYADTIIRMPGDDVDTIIDFKTANPQVMRSLRGPKVEHVMQLNCYMRMYGSPCRAKLLYLDKGDCSMREFDVGPVDMAPVAAKWSAVMSALDSEDPSALPFAGADGSARCRRCPAASVCRRYAGPGHGPRS